MTKFLVIENALLGYEQLTKTQDLGELAVVPMEGGFQALIQPNTGLGMLVKVWYRQMGTKGLRLTNAHT